MRQPGEQTDRTVLNVFGPMGHGGRYILDSLKTGAVYDKFYTDADLQIGQKINVWGRTILVVDADEFTKDFYRSKYGVNEFNVIHPPQPNPAKAREIPPYNGFGSEEDSLCSCMGLIPKPPQRDFIKFMEKDRSGLNSNVLRFIATLKTQNPVDAGRRFIVSFFLSDDTVSVFEPPQRNSGVVGGKFLERGRIRKPGQEIFKSQTSEYYHAKDLFVGAEVTFNDHIFIIENADEYAMQYMESRGNEFDKADINSIFTKLKANCSDCDLKQKLSSMFNLDTNTGCTYDQFAEALTSLGLVEHEIATLARRFARRIAKPASIAYARLIAQEQLRKKIFEDFQRLEDACAFEDFDKKGRISAEVLKTTCRAFKLPVSQNVMSQLFNLSSNAEGTIDYKEFIKNLNWRDNKSCDDTATLRNRETLYDSDGAPVGLCIECVDVNQILQSL
jgi:Ca2+-binding EF-hand superfamily protein